MDGSGVLQQLWNDHRVSAHLLGILRRCLPAALEGDRELLQVAHDIVARECEYGDRVHHAREELLFSRMASRGASGTDAVKGLAHDHNELARMGITLRESLAACLDGKPEEPSLVQMHADQFAEALHNHMHKEERRAFPLASNLLREDDWRLVAGAYADSRDPLQPPAAPGWRRLDEWLTQHGEVLFEAPGRGG